MRISVIVPTLNEERALPRFFERLGPAPCERIVADGGSVDWTREIAAGAGARIVVERGGRARQLARAAAVATGDVLVFVHAGSLLPPRALARVRRAVARGADAGGFDVRFQAGGLRWCAAELVASAWARIAGAWFGDRALFVTRAAFDAVGGFRDLAALEDFDLALRLRRHGFRCVALPGPVLASTRALRRAGVIASGRRTWRLARALRRGEPLDQVGAA